MAATSAVFEPPVKERTPEITNALLVAPGGPEKLCLFSVGLNFVDDLNKKGPVPPKLSEQFRDHSRALTPAAKVELVQVGSQWTIADAGKTYLILNENRTLNVYLPAELVVAGTLQQKKGNILKADPTKCPRLMAVLGLDCTIYGLAMKLLPFINAVPSTTSGGSISKLELAKALFAYNYSGYDPMPDWRVGQHITLPVEVDTTNQKLIVDLAAIQTLVTGFYIPDPFHSYLMAGIKAKELKIEDPEALQDQVKNDLAIMPTVDSLAQDLRNRLLTNPYEVVFYAIELMRQIEQKRKPDLVPLALAIVKKLESANDAFIQQVAWSTGGNAVLRRLWRIILAGPNSDKKNEALKNLAVGLGIGKTVTGEWNALDEVGPRTVPNEPPLTPKQTGAKDGFRNITLGRILTVGQKVYNDKRNKKPYAWNGTSFAGAIDPREWILRHNTRLVRQLGPTITDTKPELSKAKSLTPVPKEKIAERINIIKGIAENEGRLDACRALDRALISTGIQQWSAHTENELSPVLERFKKIAPDHYDLFFGMYGLDVSLTTKNNKNPFVQSNTNPLDQYFPSEVDFYEIPPGEGRKILQFIDRKECDRMRFFEGSMDLGTFLFSVDLNFVSELDTKMLSGALRGEFQTHKEVLSSKAKIDVEWDGNLWAIASGSKTYLIRKEKQALSVYQKGGNTITFNFGPNWSARVRVAGLCSTIYRDVQVEMAVWRLTRILMEELDDPITIGPENAKEMYRIADLFSSEFATALLVDQHINYPTAVKEDIIKAIERTNAAFRKEGSTGISLAIDDYWLHRFTMNYAAVRRTVEKDKRNARILKLHDGTNSDLIEDKYRDAFQAGKGTFTGW